MAVTTTATTTAHTNANVIPPVDAETQAEIAIEALLGTPVPADWADPVALVARCERLRGVASQAAEAVTELLVHRHLASTLGPEDSPVVVMTQAIEALHRELCRYRRETRRQDGLEVVQGAMEDTSGAGVAAIVTGLLERLRAELIEVMLANCRGAP